MDYGSLLGVIGGVIALVAVGVVLRVTGLLTADDARPLNTVLIWVALPALIFSAVKGSPLDPSFALLPAIGWLVVLFGLAVAWGLVKLLKLEGPTAGAFIMVAVFGNTAYVGYPVASALLGDSGLVRAIFSDVFGNTAAVISLGTIVASHYGAHDVKVNPLKEIVTFPPFIALALALVLHSVPIPDLVTSWLDALGKIVVPVIMISVGLTLKPRALRGHLGRASIVAFMKLIVLPLVALVLGLLLLPDPASRRIAVLEAGVPTMMLIMIMGLRFKLDVDFIASAILVTMLGSVLTIPLLQLLIG
ncbi:MAG: AEC family transporter [Coriobacteriia bacterium]|nr:AEC family transporter [Coriobacteriia bacterium]